MHVRDARPEDAPAIASVARASWHAVYDDLLGAETVESTIDDWYALDSLREEIPTVAAGDAGVFLVAVAGPGVADVVGFANAGPARGDDPPADAFLSRLYAHPDRWGEGVGFDLTRTVCRRLREAGHGSVWLEVFAENDVGRSFYERQGFEQVAAVDEPFRGTTLTTLHLRAPLSRLPDGRSATDA